MISIEQCNETIESLQPTIEETTRLVTYINNEQINTDDGGPIELDEERLSKAARASY